MVIGKRKMIKIFYINNENNSKKWHRQILNIFPGITFDTCVIFNKDSIQVYDSLCHYQYRGFAFRNLCNNYVSYNIN